MNTNITENIEGSGDDYADNYQYDGLYEEEYYTDNYDDFENKTHQQPISEHVKSIFSNDSIPIVNQTTEKSNTSFSDEIVTIAPEIEDFTFEELENRTIASNNTLANISEEDQTTSIILWLIIPILLLAIVVFILRKMMMKRLQKQKNDTEKENSKIGGVDSEKRSQSQESNFENVDLNSTN